jgi:beta-galactosidase
MTRRELLQSALATPAMLLPASGSSDTVGILSPVRRLDRDWEHYRGGLGGIWEVWRGKAAAANVSWTKVAMPHCFNAWDAVDPDRPYYQGPGWYRTTFAIDNPYPNGRTLLHFEGAGQKIEIYVGLECAGSHVGGYDEFTVDITAAARRNLARPETNGLVQLAVLCDNSRNMETIPSDQSDFNRYGGLYRHVNLVYAPAISLERILIDSSCGDDRPASSTQIAIRARLHNPTGISSDLQLELRVTDPSGKSVFASTKSLSSWTGAQTVASFQIPAPALWSPKSPDLYRATIVLKSLHGEQALQERFGIRFFAFPKHGVFQLNGEKLFLRGTQRHEDHAGLGAAMTDDLIRREMQLVKEVGANFIRLAHYQQSRLVLDLCDELGILVWEEIPWCRGGIGGEAYKEQARRMLGNMIDQHRNHPAVVFWGLGNENDWPGDFKAFDKNAIRAFLCELNSISHKADPSRMTAIRRCPFAADVPDVYSPSIWAGWYGGRYTEYKASAQKEAAAVDRMLHIEWGGDSHAGRHSEDPDRVIAQISTGRGVEEEDRAYLLTGGQARASRDGDWSETYICNLFDWHLKEQETMDFLAGAAQWVFKDFSTPGRPDNPVPRMNQKGLLERDLTPKEAYYVFQSYWAEKPMVHIYGHSWPVRWGDQGESKIVKVYSNCNAAELFLNGRSCGVKQRDSQDFPAAGLRWQVVFQAGENHIRVVAGKGTHRVSDEIRFRYQTEKWDKPAALVLEETGRANGIIALEAKLVDSRGVLCLDARNVVRFRLAGDGDLLQNLGTARGSRQLQMANGRAAIRARLLEGEGVVSVSSEGVTTAFRAIRA